MFLHNLVHHSMIRIYVIEVAPQNVMQIFTHREKKIETAKTNLSCTSVCYFLINEGKKIRRKLTPSLTSHPHCPAFDEHISQSNQVASIYTNRESKTNRNTNALGNNQFRRAHHNEVVSYYSHQSYHQLLKHLHVFVNTVDTPENLALVELLYWLSLSCIRRSWDKRSQQLTY